MKTLRILLFFAAMTAMFVAGYGYGRWYAVLGTAQASVGKTAAPLLIPAKAETLPALPMGTIQINPNKQQLIGVKYGTPSIGSSIKTIRAVGKIAPDEQRIAHVHIRAEGWIENVFVDFTGKIVDKNQPLLTLYSLDLLATQEEFLLALKSQELMKASTLRGALAQSDSLLTATRRRLQHWDLTEEQIDAITRTGSL